MSQWNTVGRTVLKLLIFSVLFLETYQQPANGGQAACVCGTKMRARRLIGGVETEVNEYPSTVMILRRLAIGTVQETEIRLCGGALIANIFVVSAAHCFGGDIRQSELWVSAGEYDLSRRGNGQGVTIAVAQLIMHPQYNARTVQNDIALLRLAQAVRWSESIQQACLPPYGMDMRNTMVTVTGWGGTEEGGPGSDVLRAITIPVIPTRECQARYTGTVAVIGPSTICAGVPDGSRDACQGDSGGPMFYDCAGRYSFVGVVSFGIGCGDSNFPGVYTNVSFYRDWIIQTTGVVLCGYDCRPPPTEDTDCGWSNIPIGSNRVRRVVGGDYTDPNLYPWMVSVFVNVLDSRTNRYAFTFVCGATLISKGYILTTAKCVNGYSLGDLMFVLGEYNVDDVTNTQKQVTTPRRVVIHPRYNQPFGSNDIAVVQLNDQARLGPTICPICIATSDSVSPNLSNTVLRLLGFGRTETAGPYSGRLKEVSLQTISTATCRQYYGIVNDNMVCTASSDQADACEGDSGGPLMMRDRLGRNFQLALQSFVFGRDGTAVCGSGYPSVNTKIQPYVEWIEQESGIRALRPSNPLPPPV